MEEVHMRAYLGKRLFIAAAIAIAAAPSLPLFSLPAYARDQATSTDHGDHGGMKDQAGNGDAATPNGR
jgi:hypothetical protein